MRSPASALVWAYFRQVRWRLPLVFTSVTLMTLLLGGLRIAGSDQVPVSFFHDLSMLGFAFILVAGPFFSKTAPFDLDPKPLRLPITTRTLVLWTLVPPAFAIACMHMLLATIVTLWLDVTWPMTTLALSLAATLVLVTAAAWLFTGAPVLQSMAVLTVFYLALQTIGGRFEAAEQAVAPSVWRWLSVSDVLLLLVTLCAGYAVAVFAIARVRCGAPLGASLVPRLRRDRGTRATHRRFASPLSAQRWLEGRQKTWALPANMVGVFAVLAAMATFGQMMTRDVFVTGLSLLVIVPILLPPVVGGIVGRFSLDSREAALDPFRATRPLSDVSMAHLFLRLGMRILLLSWATVAVCTALAGAWLAIGGDRRFVFDRIASLGELARAQDVSLLSLVVLCALLVPWTSLGLTATVFLTGRNALVIAILGVVFGGGFLYVLFSGRISYARLAALLPAVSWVLAPALVVAFLWAVRAARRRLDLGPVAALSTIAAWLVLVAVVLALLASLEGRGPGALGMPREAWVVALLVGASTLPVLPVALAPLALAWNRHR